MIKAGWVQSTKQNARNAATMIETAEKMGLNTLIVNPYDLDDARDWVKLCKDRFDLFISVTWQTIGNRGVVRGKQPRPVKFSDGTTGKFPCPLDEVSWMKYFSQTVVEVAKMGAHVFVDEEMYGTEKEPAEKKQYAYDTTCHCDICHRFFGPPVDEVEKRSRKVFAEALKYNPNMRFGVYPALDQSNWFLTAMASGLSDERHPVISFSTDTYGYHKTPWGADRIPADIPAYFKQFGINGIYCPGFLIRAYSTVDLPKQLAKCKDGYWLFSTNALVEGDPMSIQDEYVRTIKGEHDGKN